MGCQLSAPITVWPLGAQLLEGPVWVARDQRLWFVDIKGRRIYAYDPMTAAGESWNAPDQIGFCLPLARGGFVAGLQSGLARFDPLFGSFEPIVDPEPDLPGNRLNDAAIAPDGRLWFGTMDDAEVAATGRIYRLGDGARCQAMTPAASITNGPAFSPDGRTLYHVDTLGGVIHAASIAPDGSLFDQRVLAVIPANEGYPDGPVCDAEGCVWIGLYNGWSVRRYSPAGEFLEAVRFPVSAITKLAFGGPRLTTLYATTARKHMALDKLPAEPAAGNLLAFDVAVPGVPTVEAIIG